MEQIKEQLAAIEQELEQQPDDAGLLNEKGVGHHLLGEYDEAIRCFKRSLAKNPGDHKVHFNLGNSYYELEQIELAI
ncbi:MAG: tetratricopeptide repeat protein, partial [Balneolaceae bacterium]